ncbi:unnamed protein product, partial [marine sediment metagenome]
DFSQAEIWEVMRASEWNEYTEGDAIVREGEMEDRFYVIVQGRVRIEADGRVVGSFETGDCFGEASYRADLKQMSCVRADGSATMLSVSSTLLEQASTESQLRFNKVFLRALIRRLQGGN